MTLTKDFPGQIQQHKTGLILSSAIVCMSCQVRDSIAVQPPFIPVDEVMNHQSDLLRDLSIRPVTVCQTEDRAFVEVAPVHTESGKFKTSNKVS